MSNKVLVTYASRGGSTAGVAEAIGKTLAENGAEVEVRSMPEVKDLTPYRAVVAGSAIQGSEWLPEAVQFMQTHRSALAQKPFAMFTVCMTLAMKNEKGREVVPTWVAPVRAMVKPVREGFFAGVLDYGKVPSLRQRLMFRLSAMFGVWSAGDHRDWDAIRAWAADLKPILEG